MFPKRSSVPAMVAVALTLTPVRRAASETDNSPADPTALDWSYLHDGGAIPFIYGSAAVAMSIGVFALIDPPNSPRFFPANEGGKRRRSDSVPGYALGITGAGAFAAIGLNSDDSRWFHLKGLAQAWLTTSALTVATKHMVGRRRPSYNLQGDNPKDARVSFFSGHSSSFLAQTTYLGLYLRHRGFKSLRGDRTLPWWELASYAGLAAASIYVPYSRVRDNRHHVSDVVTGSLVGASVATAMFFWQDHRYQRAVSPLGDALEPDVSRVLVIPDLENRGASLLVNW